MMRLLKWLWNRPPWGMIFTGAWRGFVILSLWYLLTWNLIYREAIGQLYGGLDYITNVLRSMGQIG